MQEHISVLFSLTEAYRACQGPGFNAEVTTLFQGAIKNELNSIISLQASVPSKTTDDEIPL